MSNLSRSLLIGALSLTAPFSVYANSAADSAETIRHLTRELQEQRQRLDALQKQLDALTAKTQPASPVSEKVTAQPSPAKHAHAETPHRHSAACNHHHHEHEKKSEPWSPASPITLAHADGSYLNVSLVGTIAAGASSKSDVGTVQMGGHDPSQRGFTIQGIEATFEGVVDNYFRAQANVVYSLNTDGDSHFELEEAYAETLSLPYGLQFRAGQYFTEFGRINTQHLHDWDFVDAPIVMARFFGPDGLRNPGARILWQAPTPFYSAFIFGVQNSQSETAYSFRNDYASDDGHNHRHAEDLLFGRPSVETDVHGLKDMLYSARYAASADISKTQTLQAGVSGAWGPNSTGDGARTQIYGADVFWKWKPVTHHNGYPFVSVQSEVLFRGYEAAAATVETVDNSSGSHAHIDVDLPKETLWDWGVYAQINYGFREGWVASFRGDYAAPIGRGKYESILGEDDTARSKRFRLSPALTWFPSDFSRVRLQYNYDHGDAFGSAHSVWLQLEFLLGSHGAH